MFSFNKLILQLIINKYFQHTDECVLGGGGALGYPGVAGVFIWSYDGGRSVTYNKMFIP